MTSKVSICNQALGWLGGNLITSVRDDTTEAHLCDANYDELRKAVLEEIPWRFAMNRVALTQLADAPVYGYSHKFLLPSDHIRTIAVVSGSCFLEDWEQEGNTILCDANTLQISYVKDIVDAGLFSPGFVQALAARMAMDMAIPLTESRSLQDTMAKIYAVKLSSAVTLDSMQGQQEHLISNQYTRIR